MQVILKPTNKRLKQVIKEFGNPWKVLVTHPMPCFGGRLGYKIESANGMHVRNVEESDIEFATTEVGDVPEN